MPELFVQIEILRVYISQIIIDIPRPNPCEHLQMASPNQRFYTIVHETRDVTDLYALDPFLLIFSFLRWDPVSVIVHILEIVL